MSKALIAAAAVSGWFCERVVAVDHATMAITVTVATIPKDKVLRIWHLLGRNATRHCTASSGGDGAGCRACVAKECRMVHDAGGKFI
jgi:hypothetical protein